MYYNTNQDKKDDMIWKISLNCWHVTDAKSLDEDGTKQSSIPSLSLSCDCNNLQYRSVICTVKTQLIITT